MSLELHTPPCTYSPRASPKALLEPEIGASFLPINCRQQNLPCIGSLPAWAPDIGRKTKESRGLLLKAFQPVLSVYVSLPLCLPRMAKARRSERWMFTEHREVRQALVAYLLDPKANTMVRKTLLLSVVLNQQYHHCFGKNKEWPMRSNPGLLDLLLMWEPKTGVTGLPSDSSPRCTRTTIPGGKGLGKVYTVYFPRDNSQTPWWWIVLVINGA